jgi:hypothetical protein
MVTLNLHVSKMRKCGNIHQSASVIDRIWKWVIGHQGAEVNIKSSWVDVHFNDITSYRKWIERDDTAGRHDFTNPYQYGYLCGLNACCQLGNNDNEHHYS